MSSISRRFGAGVAGLAAAASIAVLAAPQASATVDSVSISSTTVLIGQEYTLTAKLSGAGIGLLVYWTDNDQRLTDVGKVPMPIGESTLKWTPSTAGQHIIVASQGGNTKSLIVKVVDPANPGTPDPGTPGDGGGTGSAGKALGSLLGGSTGSAGS
ncbi:hypothetical protein [Nocardia jejuensis]|uniref:hypothetical protein n=1 Tax=Nocardia jejuensis TaxID=328049 RepID=UPI00082998EB|nr:hypothetical protein [Nocardia jejuensis]